MVSHTTPERFAPVLISDVFTGVSVSTLRRELLNPMPAKDEKAYMHIRLQKKAAAKIKRITKKTRRSFQEEANIAVEVYQPAIGKSDE